jgi:leukotriene-A4 hydrolase
MSAKKMNTEKKEDCSIHHFEQKIPIPTYLFAIACGNLHYRVLSDRCKVWSEEEMLDRAEYEFEDTEKFIQTAESFLPKYSWEIYDILLLPGSFPYGGMENPMLTFATPTLLAGDKSLANVIAHEISHSCIFLFYKREYL